MHWQFTTRYHITWFGLNRGLNICQIEVEVVFISLHSKVYLHAKLCSVITQLDCCWTSMQLSVGSNNLVAFRVNISIRNWQQHAGGKRNQPSCNCIASLPTVNSKNISQDDLECQSNSFLLFSASSTFSRQLLGNWNPCFPLPWGALPFVNKDIGEKEKNLWKKWFQQLRLLWIRPIIEQPKHTNFPPKGVVIFIIEIILHSPLCYFFKVQPFKRIISKWFNGLKK
jgi:hypothetical protein